MESGHFYYIDDQYFVDFPDRYLMRNKETVNGQAHDRPCFYAFLDNKTGLFWMIPFSSQVDKYRVYRVANIPVRVDLTLEKELIEKANKVIALYRNGIKLIVLVRLTIEKELLK